MMGEHGDRNGSNSDDSFDGEFDRNNSTCKLTTLQAM